MKCVISFCLTFCMAVVLHAQDKVSLNYHRMVDIEGGIAYNLNTAQTVSTNNMQFFSSVTATYSIHIKQCFIGFGLGYYHSCKDRENIYPVYGAFHYIWEKVRRKPFADLRLGFVYDPYWINKVQAYGAVSMGMELYKNIQLGCRATIFSRPSRYFTANASLMLGYTF